MTTTTTTLSSSYTHDDARMLVVRAVVDAMVDAVVAVDEEDCGHATFADLCAPYITLEEARKEKAAARQVGGSHRERPAPRVQARAR